jgi:long-chain acyl-CoA synthetase
MDNRLNLTLADYFNNSVEKFHNNKAYGFVDEEAITFGEAGKIVKSLIVFLEKTGIQKGDKVAILSANNPNWGLTYFAITSMGAVAVPILPDFSAIEVANIIEHSEAKAIFASNLLVQKLSDVNSDLLKTQILIEDFSIIKSDNSELRFESNLESSNKYIVEEEDLAAIIYTSGTTGSSKGVMLTHKNLTFDAVQAKKVQPVNENDRFLSVLPLSHTFENTLGLILPLIGGARVYYLKKLPTPAVLLPALKIVKPTIMLTVPLIMEKIYRKSILGKFNSSPVLRNLYRIRFFQKLLNKKAGAKLYEVFGGKLHFFGIGGAKLDPQVERFLRDAKFPYAIGYGLTETAPMVAGAAPADTRFQGVGPAMEGVEMKLHNSDPKTGEGEVWVRGANVMKGYYKEEEKTKEVLTDDGWFKTGDLAIIDNEGFLFIKGRSKNVIIGASGENIYPEEIESVINNFKYVLESIVMEKKGKLVALVHFNKEELENQYKHLKEDIGNYIDSKLDDLSLELHAYVNSRVSKFSRVELIIAHHSPFQKTATQKIKRFMYI